MPVTRPGPETPLRARDRVLRRSNLVGLTFGDVDVVPQHGLRLLVRRSKTNQRGTGQAIALWANPQEPDFCPARALYAWLGFRQGGGDGIEGALDAALSLFVGLSKAGRLFTMALSDTGLDPSSRSHDDPLVCPHRSWGRRPGGAVGPIDQIWVWPPSTNSSAPLMKLASSDARNSTALAISSGRPTRPAGICVARNSLMPRA